MEKGVSPFVEIVYFCIKDRRTVVMVQFKSFRTKHKGTAMLNTKRVNLALATALAAASLFASRSAAASPLRSGRSADLAPAREDISKGKGYMPPEMLKYPYISTYYVKPTVKVGSPVKIAFFVTDFESSKIRFLDDSFRFTVRCTWIGPDGKAHETEQRKVPSGDGAFDLGRLPAGEYDVAVWAVDEKGRESHRVWHTFRVVEPKELEIPADRVYAVTEADLDAYGIRADGDLGRKVLVEIPDPPEGTKGDAELRFALEALDAYARTNPPAPRKGAPGYTVLIAAKDGRPVVRSFRKSRIVYDRGYDTNAVEQAAIATAEGLQRLLDDKAAAGFRKVVLAPGTYRVSAFRKIERNLIEDRYAHVIIVGSRIPANIEDITNGCQVTVLMYGGTHSFTDKNLNVAGFGAKTAAEDIAGMEL